MATAEAQKVASDDAALERTIDDLSKLRGNHLEEGRLDEAKEMDVAIDRCRDRLAERQERGVDLLNPTDELIEEAKQYGIDLRDPQQRRSLDKLMWDVSQVLDGPDEGGKGTSHSYRRLPWPLCVLWPDLPFPALPSRRWLRSRMRAL